MSFYTKMSGVKELQETYCILVQKLWSVYTNTHTHTYIYFWYNSLET